jgi:hypothetical protein
MTHGSHMTCLGRVDEIVGEENPDNDPSASGFYTDEVIEGSFPGQPFGPHPVAPGMEDSTYLHVGAPRRRDVIRRRRELAEKDQQAEEQKQVLAQDLDVDETYGKLQDIKMGEILAEEGVPDAEVLTKREETDVDEEFEKIVAWREKMLKERKRPGDNE